jgi:glutathione synthase/RimK-type ligase-like ATP-grasp enzyme
VSHRVVDWDDAGVDWAGFALVVVRSVWDYPLRRDELLDWAERVAALVPLANPPGILRWNSDKRYLLDLARAGVPVVPTTIAAPGEPVAWPEGEVVVKPTVSAGSIDTDRYPETRRAEAQAHVARLHADGRAAMVQPYLSAVESRGESALVYLDGAMVHAVRKGPMLMPGLVTVGGLFVEEDIRPAVAGEAERGVAQQALAAVPGREAPLLYARVDVVFADDGEPLLLELELVEPSLFLAHAPGVADALVRGITRRVSRRGVADRSPGESLDFKENP